MPGDEVVDSPTSKTDEGRPHEQYENVNSDNVGYVIYVICDDKSRQKRT